MPLDSRAEGGAIMPHQDRPVRVEHPDCGSRSGNHDVIKSHGGARRAAGRKPRETPLSPDLGLRWYCVQTHFREEYRALGELWQQGFRAYLPCLLPEDGERIEPMFPGYLFVAFDAARDQWRPIVATRGVRRLFSAAPERPLPVPVGIVEELQARGRAGDGVIDLRRRAPDLEGRTVRILSGPFADFTGVCQMVAADRVRVLIDLFGRSAPIDLKRADVRVA